MVREDSHKKFGNMRTLGNDLVYKEESNQWTKKSYDIVLTEIA